MASILTCDPGTAAQLLFSSSATQQHALGARLVSDDGREFRYVKAGGTALVQGKLQQSQVENTSDQNLAVAAAAIGDTTVTTTTTVTVDANEYAGGWLVVGVTPGEGFMYKIKSHPAASGAVVVLTLEDKLVVALTTSSRVDLVHNPYNLVIVNPSAATAMPVGGAIYPVTASEFGWIQVKGSTPMLADGTVVVGTSVVASNATAGAVEALTGVQAAVGLAMSGIATTEYGPIFLTLP